MALKLRVRHALGEETLALAESGASEPKVVGRSRGCDIVVPSMRVAPRHCAIFFHDPSGRWLLQNGDTRGGTSLNGIPLEGGRKAYALGRMDVITLGDDPTPPTLVVEDIRQESVPPEPQPALALPLDALAQAVATRRRPPRRRTSWAPLLGALLAAGATAAGAYGLWAWRANVPREVVIAPQPATDAASTLPAEPLPQAPPPRDVPVEVEVMPDADAESRDEAVAETVDPAGYEGVAAGLQPDDPLRDRPEWKAVVAARADDSVGRRLQAYQQFLDVPVELTGPLKDLVESWLEEELDALWWRRIGTLLDEEFAHPTARCASRRNCADSILIARPPMPNSCARS